MSYIEHFFEESTPEMLARTPRQHITTKTPWQKASILYCFPVFFYSIMHVFQYIADTVAGLLEAVLYVDHDKKKGSPLFISPLSPCLPWQSYDQCGPLMYI